MHSKCARRTNGQFELLAVIRMIRRWMGHSVVPMLIVANTGQSQEPVRSDPRPTIAVMSFSGGALGSANDFAALGQGIAELLATSLATNESVRVVERPKLQALLDEQ